MPSEKNVNSKLRSIKDPEVSKLFFTEDPEKLYEDLREIGHGSFGAVYYARNVHTNESVAIKKMSYGGKNSSEKWQDIIKEVKFLTQIQHPNIVEYKGCYVKDHTAWLTMEYCIGSASDLVEVHKHPLEEEEISGIIHEAMQGLHYLHQHNKIHRDVKAGNILLTDHGQVKLADFGSASIVSPANSFVGTPYWMAPEVILAMDEGQYDGKADIWSMGITSLELAERKPPLFNMNAMSALYHIAQNEPPTLSDLDTSDSNRNRRGWSQEFRNFIHLLLRKSPSERPTSGQVLQHPFLTKSRSSLVVQELIMRTKNVVRDLDNLQYRKMKKILIAENRQQNLQRQAVGAAQMGGVEGTIDEDGESLDGRTNSFGSVQSNPSLVSATSSSKSDSINSLNDSRLSDSSSMNSQEGASSSLSEYDHSSTTASTAQLLHSTNSSMSSMQQQQQQRASSAASTHHPKPIMNNDASSSLSAGAAVSLTRSSSDRMATSNAAASDSGSSGISLHQPHHHHQHHHHHHHAHSSSAAPLAAPSSVKNIRGGGRAQRDRFATIRSAQVIHRQLNEHNEDNRHREQLQGYKRMRQQHQKHLIQYESKLKVEMDEYSAKLTKDLDSLRQQFQQEFDRMGKRHQQELDKEAKNAQINDRKYQKHIDQQQEVEIKGFLSQQKKDYKSKKEQYKESSLKLNKEDRQEWLNRKMADLTSVQDQTEYGLRERQTQNRELEMRKHRRRALLERHNLEHNFLREELDLKQVHKKKEHETLISQHDSTQTLEYRQLHAIQELRMERLRSQHTTEMANQDEYSQRRESELKRKHTLAMRQQPKNFKSKEAVIKKQFHETIKIQEKQYKAWRNHVLETIPKKDQKEVLRRKKDEQMRKIALLGQQYDNSVSNLNQQQVLQLSDSQEKERQSLDLHLRQERELLIAYQSKVKKLSEQQHERELRELEQKVSVRRALLEERMGADMDKLDTERSNRIRNLLDVQTRAIERFDDESLRMGFSTVVITNYGDQVYVDPHVRTRELQQQQQQQQQTRRQQQHLDEGYATGRMSNMHASTSTSALQQNSGERSANNMTRSSSGSSMQRQQQQHYQPPVDPNAIPYAHRTRPHSEHRQQQSSIPQRMAPGRHSGRHQQQHQQQANSNRNNSASPQQTPFASASNPTYEASSSPLMSRRNKNVPFDEQSPMLHRVSSNFQQQMQVPSSSSSNLSSHHHQHSGSMSSLHAPAAASSSSSVVHHQRGGKSGRSLDAADPACNYHSSNAAASSCCNSSDNMTRRNQNFLCGDKSDVGGMEKKGRNSPRMGTSSFQNPQRYRPQPQQPHHQQQQQQAQQQQQQQASLPGRGGPGTSFSSSYH